MELFLHTSFDMIAIYQNCAARLFSLCTAWILFDLELGLPVVFVLFGRCSNFYIDRPTDTVSSKYRIFC